MPSSYAALRSLAIVILDTQDDAPVERTRDAPDVNSVDDVAEVEPSRGGGRKTSPRVWRQACSQRGEVHGQSSFVNLQSSMPSFPTGATLAIVCTASIFIERSAMRLSSTLFFAAASWSSRR